MIFRFIHKYHISRQNQTYLSKRYFSFGGYYDRLLNKIEKCKQDLDYAILYGAGDPKVLKQVNLFNNQISYVVKSK